MSKSNPLIVITVTIPIGKDYPEASPYDFWANPSKNLVNPSKFRENSKDMATESTLS